MKRIVAILTAGVIVIGTIMFVSDDITATGAAGSGWFDMQHCAFYKAVAAEKGLVDHMNWYSQPYESGLIEVFVVDKGYEAAYDRVQLAVFSDPSMSIAGIETPECPHCASLMTMAKTYGTSMQSFIGIGGVRLTVLTSSDPQVVAMSHEHAKRDNEALKVR